MEFLFENPLLIFVLIGIISSLFKRVQGEQEQKSQPKRPARPEQQGPTWNSEDQPAEPIKPLRTQPSKLDSLEESKEFSGVPENPFLDIQKKYEERRRENESNKSPQHNDLYTRPVASTIFVKDEEPQGVSLDLSPEADRLIEGIAWAQVLGEPRSRNPHRTMRRK